MGTINNAATAEGQRGAALSGFRQLAAKPLHLTQWAQFRAALKRSEVAHTANAVWVGKEVQCL